MKKLIASMLFSAGSFVIAQTSITTPTVSGTWTLAGSPYIVYNNIQVPSSQILTIDPGVVVKFMPETRMKVDGQLIAPGTAAAPISFEANDTIGWSNQATAAGGWNGLHLFAYSGAGTDNSTLDYCTVKDVKLGSTSFSAQIYAFSCFRGLKISNCTFTHNHSGTGAVMTEATIYAITYSVNDTIEFNKCLITNNTSTFGVLRSNNQSGGQTKILHSSFHDNLRGSAIVGEFFNILIEDNEIYNNHTQGYHGAIRLGIGRGEGMIRGNKVHHNVCDELAAIGCNSGHVTIENNLVCNNRQNNGSCGATGGGGGIHLSYNDGIATFADTYYIVRNNIIANNYSAYGGGGVYMYNTRATIANNHIINNFTPSNGNAITVFYPDCELNARNNIFYSESPSGVVDTSRIIFIYDANTIKFDYNYIPSTYSKSVYIAGAGTLLGDTSHNVIGINPGMISPTADNNYLTNALTANFNLVLSSPCINEGDTTGAFPAAIDYAHNNRINGLIDIGAYEYRSQDQLGFENETKEQELLIYPNPAMANTGFMVNLPGEGTLVVYDLNGKVVYNQPVYAEQQMVNINTRSAGMYLVRFYGKEQATGKIIIR